MRNQQLRLWLQIAAVLFFLLALAPCCTSFVPLRVHASFSSPSPRSSLVLSTSPSRRLSPPYVSRLWSPTLPPFGRASGSRAGVVNPDNGSPSASSDKAIKTEKQLSKLNDEIDAVNSEIREEKAKWEKANDLDKPVYQTSIGILNSRLERLITTRDKLIEASIAAPVPVPVPVPGKSTPLYEFCALCCRRPPLCVHMRLTFAPLACDYCFLRSSPPPPSRRPPRYGRHTR